MDEAVALFYDEDLFSELGSIDRYSIPQIAFAFPFIDSSHPINSIHFTSFKAFRSFLFFNSFILDENCKTKQSV